MPSRARDLDVVDVGPDDALFPQVIRLAASVLRQDRYLQHVFCHADESHVLGAFRGDVCVGFLRFLVQGIGADSGRPLVRHGGEVLTEAYVEAFGVDPAARRSGIGTALQAHAVDYCRAAGCHQMRSRSPVTSVENYALKIDAGYVLTPSEQNDSYYFLLRL